MFGSMNNLSKEEYQQFYSQTGIDLDNRLMLVTNFASNMEKNITKFVTFTKTIPGFATLPLEDQASLVKCRSFVNTCTVPVYYLLNDMKNHRNGKSENFSGKAPF